MFNIQPTYNQVHSNRGGTLLRESNMEALRIVAITMILIHHFIVHGLTYGNIPNNLYLVIEPFVYGGVDIFFIISGHFGIKLSLRGVIKFIITILFFQIINRILLFLVVGEIQMPHSILSLVYPISYGYWFIATYFLLMLSAPLLNTALHTMSRKQLRKVLLIFTIAIFYMRYEYATYNYLNGAFMYCLGYYLGHYNVAARFTKHRLVLTFIVSCLACGVASLALNHFGEGAFLDYENVFIVVASVSVYLFFAKLSFTSRLVNGIAACALGCYLLQDGSFGYRFLYDWQTNFFHIHGYGQSLIVMFVLSFIGIWIASFVLTSFKNLWINQLADRVTILTKKLVNATSLSKIVD